MMDKRNLLKLMVLALGVSVLLFVFGYPRGVQPIDEHTIRYVIEQEPSTLDPAKSTTSPEATVQLQLFDGLVRLPRIWIFGSSRMVFLRSSFSF